MKKFISRFLVFSILSGFVYVILVFVTELFLPTSLTPNINYFLGGNGHMNTRIKELNTTDKKDLIFLGSSHAYRGFDIRNFRKKNVEAFNLGSSNQSHLQTQVLLKRYLTQLEPKLVVYEVYPGPLSNEGVESSLDLLSNSAPDWNSVQLIAKQKHLKVFNTGIYAGLRHSLGLDDDFNEPLERKNSTYIPGGFVERELAFHASEEFEEQEWKINEDQFQAFEENIELIKNAGADVLLVYAPITPKRYRSYTNQAYLDSIYSSKALYLNFNEIVQLDDSLHFYDSHHLNQHGVQIFNEKLIEVLDTMTVFK